MLSRFRWLIVALGAVAVAAYAAETISYKYDARGLPVQINHAGSVNDNVVTNYSYDKADNRTFGGFVAGIGRAIIL